MFTRTLLALAPIALVLAAAPAQARTFAAPHVLDVHGSSVSSACSSASKTGRPAVASYDLKTNKGARVAATSSSSSSSSSCDVQAPPADEMRVRESPTRVSSDGRKEFKGHVSLLK